jgi:hypothetical protein
MAENIHYRIHIAQQMKQINEQLQDLVSSYHGTAFLANFVEAT